MFSAIIVEDEYAILKYMERIVTGSGAFRIKGCCQTPEEAIAAFDSHMPEVAFLDIEMPRMNGIELAGRMLKKNGGVKIVFTTAYSKYALDAFGVEAVDYLMKPVSEEDILRVVKRLNKARENPGDEAHLTAYCFGRFEVLDREGRQISWPTRKSEELFAYFTANQGKPLSKWKLLELFWPDLDTERGLHNLYNTIYRIKAEMKKLDTDLSIKKINEGYMLETDESFSDLGLFLRRMKAFGKGGAVSFDEVRHLFKLYEAPLFGDRDYAWSLQMQHKVMEEFRKLSICLIKRYRAKDDFKSASAAARRYVSFHAEDETMLKEWLSILASWKGHEDLAEKEKEWLKNKLAEAELPWF